MFSILDKKFFGSTQHFRLAQKFPRLNGLVVNIFFSSQHSPLNLQYLALK